MRKEYEDELNALKEQMEQTEKFAKALPLFSKYILDNKLTGKEDWHKYLNSYKQVTTHSGVYRGCFSVKRNRTMTNNNNYSEGYFWEIYINTLGEYNSHENYGLQDIQNKVSVYYYDSWNSTFYCTDLEIENLLEALNEWKINAVKQHKKDIKAFEIKSRKEKVKTLQAEIKKLEDES